MNNKHRARWNVGCIRIMYAFVCWRRWQQWHVCQIDGGANMGKPCNYKEDIIKLG